MRVMTKPSIDPFPKKLLHFGTNRCISGMVLANAQGTMSRLTSMRNRDVSSTVREWTSVEK